MARTRRIKSENDAFYHVMSRITGKRFLLKDERVKQIMLDALRRSAEFSGIKVGAYVIMDDHFHLMIEVPTLETVLEELNMGTVPAEQGKVPNGKLPEWEVLRRIAILKGEREANRIAAYVDFLKNNNQTDEAEAELDRYRRRMQDLSQFVKTFKEVFNCRYKKLKKYSGSIWGERFKSTLIENAEYFKKCRDYIELNPVRAKMVSSPEEYRWTSSGGAARGERFALACVEYASSLIRGDSPREAGDGPQRRGAVEVEEALMVRVPQVGLGKILGGKEFVGKLADKFKDVLYGQTYCPRKVGSWAYSSHGHREAA